MLCKKCGAVAQATDIFCGECGAEIKSEATKCTACGHFFEKALDLCPYCGAELAVDINFNKETVRTNAKIKKNKTVKAIAIIAVIICIAVALSILILNFYVGVSNNKGTEISRESPKDVVGASQAVSAKSDSTEAEALDVKKLKFGCYKGGIDLPSAYADIQLKRNGEFVLTANIDLCTFAYKTDYILKGKYIVDYAESDEDYYSWLYLYSDNEQLAMYVIGEDGTFFSDQVIVFKYAGLMFKEEK